MWRIAILSCLFSFCFSSCERGFDDLRENPNASTIVDPSHLFIEGVRRSHTDYSHGVLTEVWGLSTWMQVQSNLNGISSFGDEYFISGDALNNTWRLYYSGVLGNVSEAIRINDKENGNAGNSAIYQIYRAYIFQKLTDLWGDIPYSDAHNLINEENVPVFMPTYDSQESIYMDMNARLRQAVATLDTTVPDLGVQDLIYQGDSEAWVRMANSLRLRMATRIGHVTLATSQSIVEEVIQDGRWIQEDDQGAYFPHDNSFRSPFYELHNTSQGMYSPSAFLVEQFSENDDPRLEKLADYSPESVIFGTFQVVGVPSFLISSEINPDQWNTFKTSYIGAHFLDVNLDAPLMTRSEVEFLLAELSLEGYVVPGTAVTHLAAGVRSHMEALDIDQEDIETYLTGLNAEPVNLERIIQEKWKTLVYVDPIELFSEWRRTGYPELTLPNGELTDVNRVPNRLAYPMVEVTLNAQSVSAVGHGINDYATEMWWQ